MVNQTVDVCANTRNHSKTLRKRQITTYWKPNEHQTPIYEVRRGPVLTFSLSGECGLQLAPLSPVSYATVFKSGYYEKSVGTRAHSQKSVGTPLPRRGVTRVAFHRAPNYCGGRRKVPKLWHVLSSIQ